jgi:cell division protein FtsQ
MRVESPDDIRFALKGGREVRWGSATDSALKVAVMTRLLKAVPAEVYDVSAPELPTTRSKS